MKVNIPSTRGGVPAACLGLAAWVVLCAFPIAAQMTVWVDDDTCPATGSGTSGDPYCSIQQAICSIKDSGGGDVMVLPGIYSESLRMFATVSVISTAGPAVTTIDASGQPCTTDQCIASTTNLVCSVVVYGSGPTNADRLEGFTLTGGSGLFRDFGGGSPPNAIAGAGVFIFNSEPTITNNEIVNNVLTDDTTNHFWGAGIYIAGGTYADPIQPAITNNLISGNINDAGPGRNQNSYTYSSGGGLYVGIYTAPVISGNTIEYNVAGYHLTNNHVGTGGGLAVYSLAFSPVPMISNNIIRENTSGHFGGGILFSQIYSGGQYIPSRGIVDNNIIERNSSDRGGGIHTNTTNAKIRNNTIVDNDAAFGGGIVVGINDGVDPFFYNNLIVFNDGNPNGGGGMAIYSANPTISHDDFYGNLPENIGGEKIDSDYIGFNANISLDPLFEDFNLSTRDLHLQISSPAIDAGLDTQAPATDLEGNLRPLNGNYDSTATVDLGAYEFDLVAIDADLDGALDDGDESGFDDDAPCATGQSIGCDDNCTTTANSNQDDLDADGIGDLCDNCVSVVNTTQTDTDGDGLGDACDSCINDPDNDVDADGVCGDVDNCPTDANVGQLDTDADLVGNACDLDDDNDGVDDPSDSAPLDNLACRDADLDSCDDCSSGSDDVANDGTDTDSDGVCDAGDLDDDNDGVDDLSDSAPLDNLACRDVDLDGCDDCSSGSDDDANDGIDFDLDGLCDAGDLDDDNDTVDDLSDSAPFDNLVCRDVDLDGCDDCSSGSDDTANDGIDFDLDGLCDAGDLDDDNDGVDDLSDSAPLDNLVCRDVDLDSCDDCSSGSDDTANDGIDFDLDGLCDAGDLDDDNDGVDDLSDSAPLDNLVCRDVDLDGCDDCSSGSDDTANDGIDFDLDGLCDAGDLDDDNDGVDDLSDSAPLDNLICRDADLDGCDDCSSGSDDIANDGTDTDSDGLCDMGDSDDDNDGVDDLSDSAPLDNLVCRDVDLDGCDDCSSGSDDIANDGTDTDSDGLCDTGDLDDDNDGVDDLSDSAPLDNLVCRDADLDGCDDCSSGSDDTANDGIDFDLDGLCDAGDPDDDNDGVDDLSDSAPLDNLVCRDADLDGCDDCSAGSDDTANDGIDFDLDGLCDAGDPDDDNDGVDDLSDSAPLDNLVCRDVDLDGCDDCSSGSDDTANDGIDFDLDGLCDAGDPDDDNDGVADGGDCASLSRGVSSSPGPVGDTLRASKAAGMTLTWFPGVQGHTDNVYRGMIVRPWAYNEACQVTETVDRTAVDASTPAPGDTMYYLVGARNVCGDSRIGLANPGGDRSALAACAVGSLETDGDGIPDLSDSCPTDADITLTDSDGDFVGNPCDNCVSATNPEQLDLDGDGLGDACDTCTDSDQDGFGEPGYPANTCPTDNCPLIANPGQEDIDGDGRGDVCDACPNDILDDVDFDGRCDSQDNCPTIANPFQTDADSDTVGDACDSCVDSDGDGFGDPGNPGNVCTEDNCPLLVNIDQADGDSDGIGDLCDVCPNDPLDDFDGDGRCANNDNCPLTSNAAQTDGDGDGLGDACDPCFANDDTLCGGCPAGTDEDGDGACLDQALMTKYPGPEIIMVQGSSLMRYLANGSDPGLGLAWVDPGFDDSSWTTGNYGAGYEAGTGAEDLLNAIVPVGTQSVYTRLSFDLAATGAGAIENMFLGLDYDDGVVIWLNGVEIHRTAEMPTGAPDWDTVATSHESSNLQLPTYGTLLDISAAGLPALQSGVNTIAIGVWNHIPASPPSPDLVLVPQLSLNRPGPRPVRYLSNSSDPGVALSWTTPGFDDSGWQVGDYGIGYETDTGAEALINTTVPSDAYSVYMRQTFKNPNPVGYQYYLSADYNDGFVLWVNGAEVYRSPEMPVGDPAWNTDAAEHESSNGSTPDLDDLIDVTALARAALMTGSNELAIGVWNALAPTSTDLLLWPRLIRTRIGSDNCPFVANPSQLDTDGDGYGDACDP